MKAKEEASLRCLLAEAKIPSSAFRITDAEILSTALAYTLFILTNSLAQSSGLSCIMQIEPIQT